MKLEIAAIGENESFARSAVAAFALSLNPTLNDLSDIKTAVSEAVTNCVVHAYGSKNGRDTITIECKTTDNGCLGGVIHITVTDFGCGIEDLEKATSPFYTTLPSEERSGMGFTIMQSFMDEISVNSKLNEGTIIKMSKKINCKTAE